MIKKHRLSGKEEGTPWNISSCTFNGRTDELIELEPGSHVVTLGPPDNFTPYERRLVLKETSELEPREISFDLDE